MVQARQIGPFWIREELSRGGQGVVYKALRAGESVPSVALKLLLSEGPRQRARFLREARLLAELSHPNLPRFVGQGEDQGCPYLAMELVAGETLKALRLRGPLEPERIRDLLTPIAEVLQYCHERGVFHRDLKPANVLIDATGRPVLVDFGLAKPDPGGNAAEVERLSLTGDVLGTPEFMAPEQIDSRSGTIGAHTDVYGLGATLYFLLAGSPPFEGETGYNVIVSLLKSPPPDPSALQPPPPPALAELCRRALSKTPEGRPESAAAFLKELQGACLAPPSKPGFALRLVLPLAIAAGGALAWQGSQGEPPKQEAEPVRSAQDSPRFVAEGTPAERFAQAEAFLAQHPTAPQASALRTYLRPWRRVLSEGPRARWGHRGSLSVDPRRKLLLVFGGSDQGEVLLQDLWALGGKEWQELKPKTGPLPPARSAHAAAFDAKRQRYVLFGGYDLQDKRLDDHWEWNGERWFQHVGARPQARSYHAMEYDAARGQVLVFGGKVAGRRSNDLWVFDGNAWQQRRRGPQPPERDSCVLTYDPQRGRVLLFGGQGLRDGVHLNDLWEWNGRRWRERLREEGPWPSPRRTPVFTWTPQGVVLHGGTTSEGPSLHDTWVWDGEGWEERAPYDWPPPRRPAGAWHPERGVVIFGGSQAGGSKSSPRYGDTWEYRPR